MKFRPRPVDFCHGVVDQMRVDKGDVLHIILFLLVVGPLFHTITLSCSRLNG